MCTLITQDYANLEFEEVQNKLAYFKDSNLNLVTSSVINEREKLEAEFQIINAVMIELSKQVEQRKLQVSEDTPVFSIVKEASMPAKRSSPKRTKMVLVFGFIGLIDDYIKKSEIISNAIKKSFPKILTAVVAAPLLEDENHRHYVWNKKLSLLSFYDAIIVHSYAKVVKGKDQYLSLIHI